MEKRELVTIRPGALTDEPMIFSAWLHSLRHENALFRLIEQEAYFRHYHEIIRRILDRPQTIVLIACLREDEDVNLGFSVLEPNILHWVFVKPAWRGIGLMHDLVPNEIKYITHFTRMGLKIKPKHVEYNPFL